MLLTYLHTGSDSLIFNVAFVVNLFVKVHVVRQVVPVCPAVRFQVQLVLQASQADQGFKDKLVRCVYCALIACHLVCMFIVTPPPIGQRSIVMSVSVCLCVSVHDHIFGTTRPIFTKFLCMLLYGRSLILRWRRSDTLCTSGFMDDVINYLLDVAAQMKRSAHAALGLAINCAH